MFCFSFVIVAENEVGWDFPFLVTTISVAQTLAPSHKTTGEDHLEDKEGEDDLSTTPQTLHPLWITCPSQWTYPEAMLQPTGKDKETKGIGGNEDIKDK